METSAIQKENKNKQFAGEYSALKRKAAFLKSLDRGIGLVKTFASVAAQIPLLPLCITGCSNKNLVEPKPIESEEEKTLNDPIYKDKTTEIEKTDTQQVEIEKTPLENYVSKGGCFRTDDIFYFIDKLPYLYVSRSDSLETFGYAIELKEEIKGELSFSYSAIEGYTQPMRLQFIHAKDFNDYSSDEIIKEEVLYPKNEEQNATFKIPDGTNKLVVIRVADDETKNLPAGIYINKIFVIKEKPKSK